MYQEIGSLEGVPIKQLHYNDIIVLFRKAHGPLCQSNTSVYYEKGRSREAKSSSPTHNRSLDSMRVPGFVYYKQF